MPQSPASLRLITALALSCLTLAAPSRAAAPADDETMKDEKMTSSDTKKSADRPTSRAFARNGATSRPSFRPGQGGQTGPLQRLVDNADKLGLSDSQKDQIQKLGDSSREKARDIFRDANGDRDKARTQMTAVFRDTQEQLRTILTPDQQRKFRDLMSENGGFRTPNRGQSDEKMEGNGEKKSSPVKYGRVNQPKKASTQPVDVSKLEFKKLDGKPLLFSALKGKPVVLIFGSYTCPTFRENAKAFDDLALRYATKASFIMVYTKEAHPAGGWEVQRNKDAEISLPDHKDLAARVTAAKQAQRSLLLTMPIVTDSMDDQASAACDTFPNGALILDRDLTPVHHEAWASPRTLKSALEDLLAKPATRPAAE